ncbi:sugar transferase [Bacillus sp. FJAT-50079]|uniref:sugar transferase n=1 Tax=Bacillus sp. FJAT-50079 TaxID=2833577 RepID=UPI0020163824|nr:sugar transferase [Bacillus sp. FJAT-50079]
MEAQKMEGKKGVLLNDIVKRAMDLLFTTIGLIIIAPILLLISILIKIDSRGPVFFKQVRVGKNERPFKILKFRTMVVDAEKLGKQITVGKDQRITKIGHFLRKSKLDELPQLINVFKGDMSLVGPRPEVPKYTAFYTKEQKKIFNIRPGITDYASIKYRNENEILALSNDPERTYIEEIMNDKLKYNMEYMEKRSILTDIKIILLTIKAIIK